MRKINFKNYLFFWTLFIVLILNGVRRVGVFLACLQQMHQETFFSI